MRVLWRQVWLELLNEESGQDIVEYALVALLMSMCALAVAPPLLAAIPGVFEQIGAACTGGQ